MTGYRGFTRAFVKTMPVTSAGFQIETEISHLGGWTAAGASPTLPIAYRDRPEGSYSKLVDLRRRREGAHGHREPVQGLPPDGLLRRGSPCCSRCWAWRRACPWCWGVRCDGAGGEAPLGGAGRRAGDVRGLSLTAGLILDTVAKSSAARLGGRGVQGDGAVGFALAKKCGGDELTLFPRKNAFLQLLISPPLDFILAKYPGNKRPVKRRIFF